MIKLTAENIQMEGLVTANGNFKIKEDGSMEAVNGKFSGEMNAQSGYIGNFIISNGHLGIGVASTDADGKTTIKEDGNGLFCMTT